MSLENFCWWYSGKLQQLLYVFGFTKHWTALFWIMIHRGGQQPEKSPPLCLCTLLHASFLQKTSHRCTEHFKSSRQINLWDWINVTLKPLQYSSSASYPYSLFRSPLPSSTLWRLKIPTMLEQFIHTVSQNLTRSNLLFVACWKLYIGELLFKVHKRTIRLWKLMYLIQPENHQYLLYHPQLQ